MNLWKIDRKLIDDNRTTLISQCIDQITQSRRRSKNERKMHSVWANSFNLNWVEKKLSKYFDDSIIGHRHFQVIWTTLWNVQSENMNETIFWIFALMKCAANFFVWEIFSKSKTNRIHNVENGRVAKTE